MAYRSNPHIAAVAAPPIAEAHGWIAGRTFPPDRPLIDVAQAVPGYPPAAALQDHLAGAVTRPETARYTEILGRAALREALAAEMAGFYGGRIDAADVAITAGCNQAFCLALMSLAAAGDEVILPTPYYFNHQMWLEMLGITPVHLPFRAERGGVPDPADAAARINDRSRAIVLVSPNNPTGAIYPADTLAAFRDLARRHGLALVLDETYRDFLPVEGPPHGMFADPDWRDTLVHLYSFSKVYSLTGYRVGALVCGAALRDQVVKAADCVAICAPAIAQEAAQFGIERLAAFRAEKRRLVLERVARFRAVFARNDLTYELVSAGAFFAYVRHPFQGARGNDIARRLAEAHNLLCLPGSMFGPAQDGFLRFAFANVETRVMDEIGNRLVSSQDGLL